MGPIQRPLSGDVLVFDLEKESEGVVDFPVLERGGRNARTLLKTGVLRVVLVVLKAGGSIPEHHAEGPITVQTLRGGICFSAQGRDYDLRAGQMLSTGPGIRHSVTSEEGGTFLLTVAHPGVAGDPWEDT